MDHAPYVRLVDAEAEGHGRHDNACVCLLKATLSSGTLLRPKPGVVKTSINSVTAQKIISVLRLFARAGVNDCRFRFVCRQFNLARILLCALVNPDRFKMQIRTIEIRNHAANLRLA